MRRLSLPLASAGTLLLLAACASGGSGTGSPSTGQAAAPTAAAPTVAPPSAAVPSATTAPTSAPAVGGGDGAALCAAIIDINTRAGYMVDKTYNPSATTEQLKAVTLEAVARKDELIGLAPAELHDAFAAEMGWFQSLADFAAQNGWEAITGGAVAAPTISPDFMASLEQLNAFQKTTCGINLP